VSGSLSAPVIVVAGDVSVDWCFVNPAADTLTTIDFGWVFGSDVGVHLDGLPGGTVRLAELMHRTAAGAVPGATVIGPKLPAAIVRSPRDIHVTQTFSTVTPLPAKGHDGPAVWRVSDYLGTHLAHNVATFLPAELPARPDVLVLHDLGYGFRAAHEAWEPLLALDPRRIFYATTSPMRGNPLLGTLLETFADRLTLLAGIMDLRKGGAAIGMALSWEQLAEETDATVRRLPLGRAARTVVNVNLEGAVLVDRDGPTTLAFDPRLLEGEYLSARAGLMGAYHQATIAALVWGSLTAEEPATSAARGIAGARALQDTGFVTGRGHDDPDLGFPFDEVAAAVAAAPTLFRSVTHAAGETRSILEQTFDAESLAEAAIDAVLGGPESLPGGLPIETIGAWASVDRVEIEALRGMAQIVSQYVRQYQTGERLKRPLSLAVFGPPGAGKSFAVKQIAKKLLPGASRTLEYNLSQFESAGDLPPAFHEVRDAVLEQKLPLVFWDEFDTPLEGRPLGWLRHFLAPMQDGQFREGPAFHPLGPAVFVFAGGTAATLDEFSGGAAVPDPREAKLPDFVSRLRGYVNILGPNRLSDDDVAYTLRRALLLRSLLLGKAPQIVDRRDGRETLRMDRELVRAFVQIGTYLHGARSMEAIIDMSTLTGALRFERASLPTRGQLALHVDPHEFLSLVRA
jgi:hypothetical protein